MNLSNVSDVVNALIRSSVNVKQGTGSAIIQGTLQKGAEMDSTMRVAAQNAQGIGTRLNVTA